MSATQTEKDNQMTKANAYASAVKKLSKEKEYNAANTRKIQSLILLANDERVVNALSENNVDATRFNARALYATEKCIKIVYEATRDELSITDVNENAFAAIKCAILAAQHDEKLTKADIEGSILADVKVPKDREHVVFQRKAKISATAQVQQVIDMLKTLNVVKEVARNVFEVQKESALFKRFDATFAQVAAV